MTTPTYFRIKRTSLIKKCVILDGDAALAKRLKQTGETARLIDDGVELQVDDAVLAKAADRRYQCLCFTQNGEPYLTDNPNAPTAFRVLKRDAGDRTFAAAHRQLVAHQTGQLNPGSAARTPVTKVADATDDEIAVGTAISKLHQSGARGGSMALEKILHQAELKQFNLACRRAITKAAQSRYPDGESAKRSLMKCLLAESIDPARLGYR